ncbi:hypothetical protein TMatcc_008586 [Talaromyces marneffei ATCC 18224]|uniref:Uncharacterized protein n=1 Tax=Talaromyces marneffei (strain ATCC 18224 / CBS 334.59 / QM 7333) TaxID=441960 RepID=B6QLL2_TALMQ|nr:conserved hypothetical protein [Talaromyces marneffei ATCC 18224]KAE8550546.1 hypothetical protein EYB25_006774 [Talaromyces marneffei]
MVPKTRAMTGSTSSRKRSHVASSELQSRSTASGLSEADAVTRQDGNQIANQTTGSPQTPKRRQKRARFSDPGPSSITRRPSGTTGLTPAMGRAGIDGRRRSSGAQTPSRPSRRQSAPVFLSETLMDPELVGRTEPITVQFTPFRQILDARARRRLVRSGLSDVMNRFDSEKKDLKKAAAEIESLQKKLGSYESAQASGAHDNNIFNDNFETILIDDDTVDGTMVMSDSPTFNRYGDAHGLSSDNSASPEETSPITPHTGFSHPVSIMDDQSSEELRMMAEDLAAARKEKQDLFNEWRKLNPLSSTEPEAEATTPPADFMKQIVPRLEAALRTESDLTQVLKATQDELNQMGFSGPNIDAILAQMRDTFESAREELKGYRSEEKLPPRFNGKVILKAFIIHLRQVSNALILEHKAKMTVCEAHDSLRQQFDYTLILLDKERTKVRNFEGSKEDDAEDMLRVRMRLQEVERALKEKEDSIAKLNTALKKYYKDQETHENIISELEKQQQEEQHISKRRIKDLEDSVNSITNIADYRSKTIEEFKKSLIEKEKELADLAKHVGNLIEENKKLVDRIVERDQKIGHLNTRIADVSTELQSTQADLAKTEELNKMLQAHNKQHVEARDRIEALFQNSMSKFAKVFDIERKNEKRREITEKILIGTDSNNAQSEPSLPTNSPLKKSLNGALENVRLGRGKDRRTLSSSELGLDSGIGGSEPQTDVPASDAFLEAIDEEDASVE